MTFDVRRLRVLREVAAHGSMTAAARALNYTQPAISHHIRRLEREAGTALVTRAGRGVALTDAGAALVAHAEAVLARLDAAEEEVAAIAGLRAGRVRLASFPSATAALLPTAIARLREAHPGVEVSLVEAEPPASVALLRAGDCDLALDFEYPGVATDEGADFAKHHLFTEPLVAVLPRGHPLAAGDRIPLPALAGEAWIAGCERCRGHLLHACTGAGFSPRVVFATDDYVAVQSLIAAGLGVALLPRLVFGLVRNPGVTVVPLDPPPTRAVTAIVRADERKPPAVTAALDALRSVSGARNV